MLHKMTPTTLSAGFPPSPSVLPLTHTHTHDLLIDKVTKLQQITIRSLRHEHGAMVILVGKKRFNPTALPLEGDVGPEEGVQQCRWHAALRICRQAYVGVCLCMHES